jgi:hypothetical protein
MALQQKALNDSTLLLATIKQAAWELGVLLVEQADFSGGNAERVQLTPAQLQLTSAAVSYELLRYAGQGITSFIIEYPSQSITVPFFSRVSYRGPEQGLFAEFNDAAYEELNQLQRGIHLLRRQQALTLTNLTGLMRRNTPHLAFDMVVKRLPKLPVFFVG